MFKKLYRKFLLPFGVQRNYDKDIYMLLYDENKLKFIIFIIRNLLFFFFALQIGSLIENESNFIKLIGIILCVFVFVFYIKSSYKFTKKIIHKGTLISNFLFFSIYTKKGKAISNEDFKIIKKCNKNLYDMLRTKEYQNKCYQICFWILQALQKGCIKFVKQRVCEYEEKKGKYTMHVLYVKGDWCFDTFSRKQYLTEEYMNIFKAKEYANFSYKDVEGKDYFEFKKEHLKDVKDWCKENDCYSVWLKD